MTNIQTFLKRVKSETIDSKEEVSDLIQQAMDCIATEGRPEDQQGGIELRSAYYSLSKLRDCFKKLEKEAK